MLIFEGICSFYITERSKSTISDFYFRCVFLGWTFYRSRLEIINYMSEISRYVNNSYDTMNDTMNALYFVEWFVLSWIIYTQKVQCILNTSNDLHCCWMIWSVKLNFLQENIPRMIASELSLLGKSRQWTLPHKKTSLMKISPVKITFQKIKYRLFLISKTMKIKVRGTGILQTASRIY